jgi:ComF family protein
VPLHDARLRERGFNQTLEIYRELRRTLNIPLLTSVTRAHRTQAQSLLSAEQRVENIRDVFAVKAGASLPAHIAILDDVLTTGATSNELSRVLKAAGVSRVSVWAIARATPRE